MYFPFCECRHVYAQLREIGDAEAYTQADSPLTRGQHRTGAESDIYDCLVTCDTVIDTDVFAREHR